MNELKPTGIDNHERGLSMAVPVLFLVYQQRYIVSLLLPGLSSVGESRNTERWVWPRTKDSNTPLQFALILNLNIMIKHFDDKSPY